MKMVKESKKTREEYDIRINIDFWNYDPQFRVLKTLILNRNKDMTLREIGIKSGFKINEPQRVKHHLQQLLTKGFLYTKEGNYFLTDGFVKNLTVITSSPE